MREVEAVTIMVEPLPVGAIPPKTVRVTARVKQTGERFEDRKDAEFDYPFELGSMPELVSERIIQAFEKRLGRELMSDEQELVTFATARELGKLFRQEKS